MDNAKNLIYDGSFNGFLTAIFIAFEKKLTISGIQKNTQSQRGLFSDTETIFTDMDKAKRVWNGIGAKSNGAIKNIYFAFLSETKGIELLLYRYIKKKFASPKSIHFDYVQDIILKINHLTKMVSREKHRMETYTRFQLTRDGIHFAPLEPNFNILPLISKHFRSSFGDQEWIIYDVKRKYGLYYNLVSVEIISLDHAYIYTNSVLKNDTFSGEEYDYRDLWKNYFKNIDIKSCINRKLHSQRIPKKQWKYLNEKRAV